jgi:hypothetical protein
MHIACIIELEMVTMFVFFIQLLVFLYFVFHWLIHSFIVFLSDTNMVALA